MKIKVKDVSRGVLMLMVLTLSVTPRGCKLHSGTGRHSERELCDQHILSRDHGRVQEWGFC